VVVEWSKFARVLLKKDEGKIQNTSPSLEDIYFSSVVFPSSHSIDVLSILLEPIKANADYHLGAQVFFRRPGRPLLESPFADVLHDDLMSGIPKGGYEAHRSGGALGRCDPTDPDFKAFLHAKGTAPRIRRACSIIIVNSETRCGFYIFYRSPYKPGCPFVRPVWYNTPRRGGHQSLKYEHLKKFEVLRRFPWCRVMTALLCLQYNKARKRQRKVISEAARRLLEEYELAKTAAAKYVAAAKEEIDQGHKPPDFEYKIFSNPCSWLALWSSHTLVTHSVRYHLDVFAKIRNKKGTDCIENKLLALHFLLSTFKGNLALGRGGAGPGIYLWALLDWQAPIRARHRVYLEQGGNPTVRVTQSVMDDFLSQQAIV